MSDPLLEPGALSFPRPVPPIRIPGFVRRRMCGRWRFEVNVNERRVILGFIRIQDRGRGEVARIVVVVGVEGCQTEKNVALAGRETGPGVTASVVDACWQAWDGIIRSHVIDRNLNNGRGNHLVILT